MELSSNQSAIGLGLFLEECGFISFLSCAQVVSVFLKDLAKKEMTQALEVAVLSPRWRN